GQSGHDTLQFNGSNIAEHIGLSANGSRLRFTRDIAAIAMDVAGVEQANFVARGGADVVDVGDLSATEVTGVAIDLGTDGAADRITVSGTAGRDRIAVSGDSAGVTVGGLAASVGITGSDGVSDALTIDTLAGDDLVDASGLAADAITFDVKD